MNEKYPDTVDRIIAAAIAEFSEKGYYGARVSSVAERAGVSKALIYYHFKSKQDIMNKIEDRLVDDLVNILDDVYSDYNAEGFSLDQHRIAMQSILENKDVFRILMSNELRANGREKPLENLWNRVNEKRRWEVIGGHGYNKKSEQQYKIEVVDFFFILIPIILYGALGEDWAENNGVNKKQSIDYFVETIQLIYDSFYK